MTGQRSYPRADRVRRAIQEVLASEIERLRDPGLGFVTVTDVSVSPDLRRAVAFYTVYGSDVERASSQDALARATKHLRGAIARQVRLKFVPTLEFQLDPVPDRAARIEHIIGALREEESE